MLNLRDQFASTTHTLSENKNGGYLPVVEPTTTPPPPIYAQAPSLPTGTQAPLQSTYYQTDYSPHPELHANQVIQRKRQGRQRKICLSIVALCVLSVAGIIVGVVVNLSTARARCSEASNGYGTAKACL